MDNLKNSKGDWSMKNKHWRCFYFSKEEGAKVRNPCQHRHSGLSGLLEALFLKRVLDIYLSIRYIFHLQKKIKRAEYNNNVINFYSVITNPSSNPTGFDFWTPFNICFGTQKRIDCAKGSSSTWINVDKHEITILLKILAFLPALTCRVLLSFAYKHFWSQFGLCLFNETWETL